MLEVHSLTIQPSKTPQLRPNIPTGVIPKSNTTSSPEPIMSETRPSTVSKGYSIYKHINRHKGLSLGIGLQAVAINEAEEDLYQEA